MQYFYEATLKSEDKNIQLSEQESRHAIKVLRMQVGQAIHLVDGQGGLYKGTIQSTQGKKCMVELNEYHLQEPARPHHIHIAIAPTKNIDRTEWFIEKAVEIGVDKISFIQTRYSERKIVKMERIQKTAVAAMKQSGNLYLPKFQELTKLSQFIGTVIETGKYIAYVPANSSETLFKEAQLEPTCILIGPEGGFSENEVELVSQHGFKAVSLGKSRLRTETAGIAACHLLNLKMS